MEASSTMSRRRCSKAATVDVSGSFVSDTPEVVDDQPATEAPYHVFTIRMKWQVVLIVSLAGLFSSLSSNIYFPAIPAIAAVSSKERRDAT
jgi:hypothetical protein